MKRWKKWLIWGVLGVVAIISCLGIYVALASWRAGARLEALLTPLRVAGEPLGLADLAREPIPPETNAAVFLRRAENDLEAIDKEFQPLHDQRATYYLGNRLTEKGAAIIAEAFGAYPNASSLVERAAACPDYDPQHDYTFKSSPDEFIGSYLPRIQAMRMVVRVLTRRGDLLLHQGRRDDALRNDLALLRITRHFEHEPLLVGRLVTLAMRGIAIDHTARVLADGPIASELLDDLDRELSTYLDPKPMLWTLKSDRAFGIEHFQFYADIGIGGGWWLKDNECDYLELLSGELEVAGLPRYQVASRLTQLEAKAAGAGWLAAQTAPATQAWRDAEDRVRSVVQCLRVLSALLAHGERTGDESPDLAALKLPAEWTTDPYDGQPLRFKKAERGWLVYAVGNDLKDDGGDLRDRADVGVGPDGLEPLEPAP